MKLDDEIDALFRLPLAEFTGARNTLAARLKKDGRRNDADRIKLLAKPSISAWAVNQLYWDHRDAFNRLMAAGKRFRPVNKLRVAAKPADMRDSLDARRAALVDLAELAAQVLSEAGHNPSPDTIRRVTTTLEALSASALVSDGPTPGRLTQDLDPPSFESLALLMSGIGAVDLSRDKSVAPSAKKTTAPVADIRQIRQVKIAAAKSALQEAKKSLSEARAKAQGLEVRQKKADAEAKEAEKYRREAEQRLAKATAIAEAASGRAKVVAGEFEQASDASEDAKRVVDRATKELESLLREP